MPPVDDDQRGGAGDQDKAGEERNVASHAIPLQIRLPGNFVPSSLNVYAQSPQTSVPSSLTTPSSNVDAQEKGRSSNSFFA